MDELTFDEEAAVLERIVRNQLAIKELEEDNELLKQFFKEREEKYPAGSETKRGKFFVRVSTNSRIDPALARKELSPDEWAQVTTLTVDAKRARAYLDADKLSKITKKYDNRLTIGLVE